MVRSIPFSACALPYQKWTLCTSIFGSSGVWGRSSSRSTCSAGSSGVRSAAGVAAWGGSETVIAWLPRFLLAEDEARHDVEQQHAQGDQQRGRPRQLLPVGVG